jgi:hypothetical protein
VEYWARFLDQHGTAMTLAGCAMARFAADGLITEARDCICRRARLFRTAASPGTDLAEAAGRPGICARLTGLIPSPRREWR